MNVTQRARVHAALGDPLRLAMVEELRQSDRTFQELAGRAELPGNAAAHHLRVLESAGLISRRVSEGDRRRRYITLDQHVLAGLGLPTTDAPSVVLFVCTHNSARSQFAASLWASRTGGKSDSAGVEPAGRVHPMAVRAARNFGIDLSGATPKAYDAVRRQPDLVISVCDRAREAGVPFAVPSLHWSIPDPVRSGTSAAFQSAFAELAERVDRLASAIPEQSTPKEN